MSTAHQDFIEMVSTAATASCTAHKLLKSPVIADACVESGYGEGAIFKLTNNLFSILGNGWPASKCYLHNGISYRKYDSISESIEDHAVFLVSNERYKNIIGNTDYVSVCNELQTDGYDGDSKNYSSLLIDVIKENNLTQYDILEVNAPQPVKQVVPITHIETIKSGGSYYVRSLSTTTSSIAGYIKGGTKIETKILPNGWRQVEFNGKTAYIGPGAF
jgi:lysozyme